MICRILEHGLRMVCGGVFLIVLICVYVRNQLLNTSISFADPGQEVSVDDVPEAEVSQYVERVRAFLTLG